MQRAVTLAQILDGEERVAIERRQELHARVDRLELHAAVSVRLADDDRARAAVTFGAAFLRAGAARVFAEVLQDGARRRRAAHFLDRMAVIEADRLAHVICLGAVRCFSAGCAGCAAGGMSRLRGTFRIGPVASMVRKLSPPNSPTHRRRYMSDIFVPRYVVRALYSKASGDAIQPCGRAICPTWLQNGCDAASQHM